MAKTKKNYVNNKEFLECLKEYKTRVATAAQENKPEPRIPEEVGLILYNIATKLSYRYNFINYSYRDDMVSDGLENAIKAIPNFDPEKWSNPFSYFTTVIFYAFIRRIKSEQKQLYIKNKLTDHLVINNLIYDEDENTSMPSSMNITNSQNESIDNFMRKYEDNMTKNKKSSMKAGVEKFYGEE